MRPWFVYSAVMVSRPCSAVILARASVSASSDLRAPYAAQLVALGLEFNGPFCALARSGSIIVFGGHREALPDTVNGDMDALAGLEE